MYMYIFTSYHKHTDYNYISYVQLELCREYSVGHFGGISRSVAYQYIKQV